jgi:hypothetical protein
METNFLTIKERYRKVFLEIKDLVSSQVENGKVKITIGDHYVLNNTPLYIVLEFHVAGREAEDDYGLCLSVSYQYYNPTLNNLVVSANELFISADLTRANAEAITYFGLSKLDFAGGNFQSELEEIQNKIIVYLKSQVSVITEILRTGY